MSKNFLAAVSAVVLTYNEASNIDRTLSKLGRLRQIIVIDSESDDGTREIVTRHRNARLVTRAFDNFASQCNFGLAQIDHGSDWVLSLDADYLLGDDLIDELAELSPPDDVAGYRARIRYCVLGRAIRSGVYPPVVALFRCRGAKYIQDGHAHRVFVEGRIENLQAFIYHDDRKPLSRWLDSQTSYARHEADHLGGGSHVAMRWQDRVRLIIGAAPLMMFLYVFLVRGGIFDGKHGLYYALQRAYAELLLSLELLDRRLRSLKGS